MKTVNAILFILLFNSLEIQSQSLDAVLANYFAAVGGLEQWKNISTRVDYYQSGHLEDMINPNSNFNIWKTKTGVHLYKSNQNDAWDRFISIPQNSLDTFTTCYNGDKYWSQLRNNEPTEYPSFTDHYRKFVSCGQPCFILNADSLSYGKSEGGLEILQLHLDSDIYLFYFSDSTKLLVKSHKMGYTTITYYKDYRNIGSLFVPFVEEVFKDGTLVSRSQNSRTLINETLSDKYFKFPNYPYPILSLKLKL